MGFFDIFKRKTETTENHTPPKELFIEEEEIVTDNMPSGPIINLDTIYNYVDTDFEEKGYNDALVSPDLSYRDNNLKLLKYDLQIMIKRAFRTYDDYEKDLEFHLSTRKEAGLIDTVKLIESKLLKVKEAVHELSEIDKDYNAGTGLVERIELSYQRGFSRGLAAMSDEILNRNV